MGFDENRLSGHSNCSVSLHFDTKEESTEYHDDIDNSFSSRIDGETEFFTSQSHSVSVPPSSLSKSASSQKDSQVPIMTARQTRNLCRLRGSLLLLLLGAIATVVLTIRYGWHQEQGRFKAVFAERAIGVISKFQSNLQAQMVALESFGVAVSSYVSEADAEESWPFVTVPHFEVEGISIRTHTDLLSMMLVPIIARDEREAWESYSIQNRGWVTEGVEFQENVVGTRRKLSTDIEFLDGVANKIFRLEEGEVVPKDGLGPYYPIWQTSPALPATNIVNFDTAASKTFSVGLDDLLQSEKIVISEFYILDDDTDPKKYVQDLVTALLTARNQLYHNTGLNSSYHGQPLSNLFYPLFNSFTGEKKLEGMLTTMVDWEAQLSWMDPISAGIVCVLENDCGQQYTYQIGDDGVANFLGVGDLHDTLFDSFVQTATFEALLETKAVKTILPTLNSEHCVNSLRIYPSEQVEVEFNTTSSRIYLALEIFFFVFILLVLITYDRVVARRHLIAVRLARDSNAIVASLFPANVRERLFQVTGSENLPTVKKEPSSNPIARVPSLESVKKLLGGCDNSPDDTTGKSSSVDSIGAMPAPSQKHRLKHFLREGQVADDPATAAETEEEVNLGKPIADLFPNTTVLFADISGFTAWSSEREPEQVFTLLQTVYHAFDLLAKKRNVFKVETIGDCYVAVTGLPDPQDDHAVKMVKFARECMAKMHELTKKLEVSLGPGTADLNLRMGLNSGPVTAGVLRGEKSRFQLFGDTVNTASRMESTGQPKKIQISQSTASLLRAAGKGYWVREREDLVQAKGKGEVQTYWVIPRTSSSMLGPSAAHSLVRSGLNESPTAPNQNTGIALMWGDAKDLIRSNANTNSTGTKSERLIDWQVDMLSRTLKQVVEFRAAMARSAGIECRPENSKVDPITTESSVIDEVTETVTLPQIDHQTLVNAREAPVSVELSPLALKQLREYVESIAALYRKNPFHNFEHANHVTQSVSKLLSRVKEPGHLYENDEAFATASDLHYYTHGITSDPLTQFAVVFSALIHDVDHPGVPNAQLIKEKPHIGVLYNNQSVAEQNSVELAWELLMEPNYEEFQKCIYTTEDELKRFRQLVVNVVMATDIFDKDMTAIRNRRWNKAFHRGDEVPLTQEEDANLKATIVLEHLIQASDVSHTMQHWHIYTKWNERLFREMYSAYESGRAAKDPSEGWYKGELWFFDNYIIPLAKKLEECQVFGVSSDEYLNYALENRREWELKGARIVESFLENYHATKEEKPKVSAAQNLQQTIFQQLDETIIFDESEEEKQSWE